MNFAEKLKSLRIKNKLTQEEFAKELNFAISAVRNYENVKKPRIPDRERLKKIADFYKVDMGYLLDDDIQNKSRTNIDLSKELGGLSNEDIKKIKILDSYMDTFNFFVKCTDLQNLIKNVTEYKNLQNINRKLNNLLNLIHYDFKKSDSVTVIKNFKKYYKDIQEIFNIRITTECMKFDKYAIAELSEKVTEINKSNMKEIAKEKLNGILEALYDYKDSIDNLQIVKEYQLQKEIMSIIDNIVRGDKESGNT